MNVVTIIIIIVVFMPSLLVYLFLKTGLLKKWQNYRIKNKQNK